MFQLYKKAYSGIPVTAWWLSMIIFVNRCGSMVIPFLTMYLTRHVGFSIPQAGLVMAVYGAGGLIGVLAGGQLSDRLGFYAVQFWSLIGNGVLFIILGRMQGFYAICSIVFAMACIGEAFRPANSTAITVYSTPETRTRAYSLNRLAVNLGFSIGPAVGGILANISYQWLFWADGITCILAAILMRIFITPRKAPPKPPAEKRFAVPQDSPFRDGPYLVFTGLVAIFAICFLQLASMGPLYMQQVLLFNERTIGLFMASNGIIVAVVEMVLVYKLEGRRHPLWFITLASVILGISFLCLLSPLPGLPAAAGFTLCLTFGELFGMPFMNVFWVDRSATHNRARYAALYAAAYTVANVVAPVMGSQIVGHFGFGSWWWTAAGMSFCTAAGFALLRARIRAA